MASRSLSRTFSSPISRQLINPTLHRRTLTSASKYARATLAVRAQPTVTSHLQQTRGLKQIDFAGTTETVYGQS